MTITIKSCEICGKHVDVNQYVVHRDECSQDDPSEYGVVTPSSVDDVRGGGSDGDKTPMGHRHYEKREYFCDTCGREVTTSRILRKHSQECEEGDYSTMGVVESELPEGGDDDD